MAQVFYASAFQALSSAGAPLAGAKLFFFKTGTTTAAAVYADAARTSTLPNPVIANAQGRFPQIYPNPDQIYRVRLTDSADVQQWQEDPVSLQLFIRTDAEIAAGVVPANFAWPAYESRRYGTLGGNQDKDADALTAMLNAAAKESDSSSVGLVELKGAGTKFLMKSGLSFDPEKVLFDGHGHTLDFSAHANVAFVGIKLVATNDNLNRSFMRHSVRGMRNVTIEMPSYTLNAESVGIELIDEVGTNGSYRAAGIPLENISVLGGAFALKFGNGAWGSTITNFSCGHDSGNLGGVGVYAPAPWTDGGECPKFLGGHIANRTQAFHLGVGSVKVIGMSIDGCPIIGYLADAGQMTFLGGYSEFTDGDDIQYKFSALDANAVLEIANWEFTVRPDLLTVRTKALINTDGGVPLKGYGTVILRNLKFQGNNAPWYQANGGFLVEGPGVVYASGLIYKNFPWAPLPHKKLQWLAYPDFNHPDSLAAFFLQNSGAFNPVRALQVAGGGSPPRDAVRFQINAGAVAGSFSRAVFTHRVSPGKRGTLCGQLFGLLASSNTKFECKVTHKDQANNVLTEFTESIEKDFPVFTTFGIDLGTFLPGTETVELQIQLVAKGVTVGNTTLHVSPMGIGYADGE